MLTKLTLYNFQCHEKFILEFDPSVTFLLGSSDVGKSAIFRSLEWIMDNRISGDDFIHHGKDTAKVTLEVDEHTITRIRGKGENLYRLDDQEYKSFNTAVPKPVADLINIGNVNFQGQHDKPWWFSDSEGQVSRNINAIINLSIIDSTLSYLSSQVRKANERVSLTEERLKAMIEERELLRGAKLVDEDLRTVEEAELESQQAQNAALLLSSTVQGVLGHDQTAKNAAAWSTDAKKPKLLGEEWLQISEEAGSLDLLITRFQHHDQLSKLKFDSLDPIISKRRTWKESQLELNNLRGLLFDLAHKEQIIEQSSKELTELQKQLEKKLKEERICFKCGQPLIK